MVRSWHPVPSIPSWQIEGENMEAVTDFIFLHSKITADGDCSHEIKRCLLLGRKVVTNLDSIWKAETSLCQQGSVSWSYVFSSSPIRDHKEGWVPKNWCFQIVVLEKTLCESLGQRQDQTSQSQTKSILNIHWRDWCWSSSIIEAEAPIFWPTNRKSWLIGKDRDAGKDRGQEEKGMAEDEMVR